MSANDRFFVDTNLLLYSFSANEPNKRLLAEQWLSAIWPTGNAKISWQVVNEFYSNAIRKFGVPVDVARTFTEQLVLWNPEPQTEAILKRGWYWCDTAKVNYWDSLIIAAAEQCGCRYLLSEDLQANRKFGEVEIINPF
ncbi:MAG: PIN domain-containing protein [Acidobacteriota bacterium]